MARLQVKKEGAAMVGRFSEAPRLRMRLRISESGTVLDCTGDCYVFVGYKPKVLRGMLLSRLMAEEEIAGVALDTKCAVSLRCKNGLVVFATLRVAKVRLSDGTAAYEGAFKSAQAGDGKSVLKVRVRRLSCPPFFLTASPGRAAAIRRARVWVVRAGPLVGPRHVRAGAAGGASPERRGGGHQVRVLFSSLLAFEASDSLSFCRVRHLSFFPPPVLLTRAARQTLSRQRYRELNMVYPPQELRLLERVRHPNLVRMLDTIWADDDVFIVMELINGGEFFEYCMAAGALGEPQAQCFWRQLVSGVDYLHRGGICHRDISKQSLGWSLFWLTPSFKSWRIWCWTRTTT